MAKRIERFFFFGHLNGVVMQVEEDTFKTKEGTDMPYKSITIASGSQMVKVGATDDDWKAWDVFRGGEMVEVYGGLSLFDGKLKIKGIKSLAVLGADGKRHDLIKEGVMVGQQPARAAA